MILTDRQINEAYQQGKVRIDPFADTQLQPASYDLRVGEQGISTSSKKLVNIKDDGYLLIQPGDFAILTVLEELQFDAQHTGRLGLRSKYARKGLIATTGPQVDTGYSGRLIVGITNLSPTPISLSFKDDLLSLELHRLEEPVTKPYSGPYQKKLGLGAEEIESITEGTGMAFSEAIATLQSLSQNVASVAVEVKTLKWSVPLIVGIGVTVIGIIVGLK